MTTETRTFPGFWQGAGIAVAYLALSTWLDTLVQVATTSLHVPVWLAMLPGFILGFPLTLAFGVWLGRMDLWDILAFRRVRPGVWAPLVATHTGFFLLILAFVHGLEAGLDRLPQPFHQSLLQGMQPLAGAATPAFALMLAAAAVPEEILFRGLILRGLLGRFHPRQAVWLSALLFTVAHGNPLQFPVALMIGACAGWYYQATGSLWPGFAAHALHNLAMGLALEPEHLREGSLRIHPLPSGAWLLAAPLLAAGGLLWMRWVLRQPEPPRTGILALDGDQNA